MVRKAATASMTRTSTLSSNGTSQPSASSLATAATSSEDTQSQHHVRINPLECANPLCDDDDPENNRLVAVRYFLDRPGYDLHNAAARLWFHPPGISTPMDVLEYLKEQGIALPGLLVEVYLDKFAAFMMVEACQANLVEWDFTNTTYEKPGRLDIRLTDLALAREEETITEREKVGFPCASSRAEGGSKDSSSHANTTPVGLFSFSMMVGLETVALMIHLIPNSVNESFVLAWGPYMFFVGGLMQVIVGILQVFRGNIYGSTAFLVFGCFWFSNGTIQILEHHFAGELTPADELIGLSDPWGLFLRSFFVLAFSCALLKQTFVMNRLSTTLITLLCLKVACGSVVGWSENMKWAQLVLGWMTSVFAFYVFLVEFTNQVYHREVFPTFKWNEDHSPEEVFGAAGKLGTLFSKAARLRQARYPTLRTVREATSSDRAHRKDL